MAEEILEGQIGSGKEPVPATSESTEDTVEADPQSDDGQAVDEGSPQSGKEQAVAGLPDGMTLETLPSSYKSLQAEYTKGQQASKELTDSLAPFGGPEQMIKWASYLSNNPSFAKWARSEQQKESLGTQGDPNSEVDEDTQKALDIVERVATQKANQMYQDKIAPLENTLNQERLEENMKKMDADPRYSNWNKYKDRMADISESLPGETQNNPSLDELQDLYWRAVRASGDMEEVMANAHAEVLKSKQSKSTERPTSSVSSGVRKKAMSISEAFEQAKRGMG